MRLEIYDETGSATINLFPREIATLTYLDYSTFVDYVKNGVDVGKLFSHLPTKTYIFVLSIKTYKKVTSLLVDNLIKWY